MQITRKVWLGAGAVAVAVMAAGANGHLGQIASPAHAADAVDMFPGKTLALDVPFAKALGKMLEGEGGEGGIGFTAAGPEFVAPALTSSQLAAALPGNTIRKDQAVAFYFGKDGIVEGWKRDWSEADMNKCPTKLGDNYEIDDDKCYTAVVNPIKGKYTIKDNQVCMPAYSGKVADGEACYYFGFVTRFVMIGDGQKTYGSGKDIVEGKVLDVFMKKEAE